ncbi:MAG: head-tail joining protein [Stenotrophomonas sp.]|uniref:head-tail joining protein n=1 Tax=Stenotrophomonas sp. TaxID=69392 RepID=UPI003D6CBCF8
MSQREFLANLDADLHASFAAGGMADVGLYTAPGDGIAVSCQVYVDRDVETIGGLRQFMAGRIEIAYVRQPGLDPVQGGKVVVDGDTYVNGKLVSDDGSASRWTVRNG